MTDYLILWISVLGMDWAPMMLVGLWVVKGVCSYVYMTDYLILWNFLQFRTHKVIYRRYAGLFFSLCVDITDNELAYLECIHLFVEILDHFFSNVCELDLVFNFHKVSCLHRSFVHSYIINFHVFWILPVFHLLLFCQ